MNKLRKRKRFLSLTGLEIILLTTYFLLPTTLIAQTPPAQPTEYELLAPIPHVTTQADGSECVSEDGKPCATTASYLPGLFKLIIAIAGALAVVRLIWAGIKYMSTDAFSEKSEAKGIIENALWGLLLAMSAWLIIYTVNPELVDFNLNIPIQKIATSPAGGGIPPPGNCVGCIVVGVPHKLAPLGCAAPGPCVIQSGLNTKLINLNKLQTLLVTEAFPPTRTHRSPCHSNGSCVDATISSANEANIKKFIENASSVGLDAQFETTTEKRARDIRNATGLSTSQVYYVAGITGEHFSVYNK